MISRTLIIACILGGTAVAGTLVLRGAQEREQTADASAQAVMAAAGRNGLPGVAHVPATGTPVPGTGRASASDRQGTASPLPPPTPTPSIEPSRTPELEPTASPALPSVSPTPLAAAPVAAQAPMADAVRVVINEIAWAGTAANAADEWIELFNAGSAPVDLSGWALFEGDTKIIGLSGIIGPGSFFLVERTDDSAVSDITADIKGPFGGNGLKNSPPAGERLSLRDAAGAIIDEVDCSGGPWFGGDSASRAAMERVNPLVSGSSPSNWGTNDGTHSNGTDVQGNPILGTPRARNSTSP